MSENAIEKPAETGMTQAQREEMLKDDSLGNLKLVHGIMIANLKMAGVKAEPGDFLLNGVKTIPAGMQGPGFVGQVLCDRPRAVLFDGNNLLSDSFDPNSATWKEIAAKAAGWVKGAKVGAEMLLFLPDYNSIAMLMVANKERQTLYPLLCQAMATKKWVQFNSGCKNGKHGLQVFTRVELINDVLVPKYTLDDERRLKAIATFEAYKQTKAAPAGRPNR